ncbi:MAG: beta-galactosidase [Candidatus Acidiferrales bacterium]
MRTRLTLLLIVASIGLTASCAGIAGSKDTQPSIGPAAQTITISPSTLTIRAGATQQFTAVVTGASNPQITWLVNGIQNGSVSVGSIAPTDGLVAQYTAPSQIPTSNPLTITASVSSTSSLSSTATLTVENPVPQLASISPSQVGIGSFTITASGNSFVSGAKVNFGSTALQTTFVSSTTLTAVGTAASSQAGNVSVTVTNPNPGSATSGSLSAQVLTSSPAPPQISANPVTVTVPAGGAANVVLTTTGTPAPTVDCSIAGQGTAQLSGSTLTYTGPTIIPEDGHDTISCAATSAAGSATAQIVANISTAVAGYNGPIPSTFFGLHYINAASWPSIYFGAQGKMPGTTWPSVEPASGQFNWTRLDLLVANAKAHGIGVMYSTAGAPQWAVANGSTCTPDPFSGSPSCTANVVNLADWDAFVTALVTRYQGQIQIYELWNEPQNSFSGTVPQMVALTQHEHDIIRTLDPSATILSPSIVSWGYQYMDSYFAAGGTVDVDGIAFHSYPDPSNDIPETITGSLLSTVRTVMTKYGLANKPMWDTEGSWGYASAGAITDPNLRAAFVARHYLLHWSMGISRFYWYCWDDPNIGTLFTPGAAPSQPAVAYQQVYSWMHGAALTQPCSDNGASSSYHAIYSCELTRSGGSATLAVWNTEGDSTYSVPAQYIHYRDLAGNVSSVPSNHQVTIGVKPILLENF